MCNNGKDKATEYAEAGLNGFHCFGTDVMKVLLKDRTTNKNIIWATDDYSSYNPEYTFRSEITLNAVMSNGGTLIQPRMMKSMDKQLSRIRDKAEVFTPSWICNEMNNLVDEAWFGYKGVFNTQLNKAWKANEHPVVFPNTEGKDWQTYVKNNILEITCGEAPFLVSRYDTVSGNIISISERIGMLDRKLRVVNENVSVEDRQGWIEWVKNAYKGIYGYEWQGDNLLLARENLLYTLFDYYEDRFKEAPTTELIIDIAYIISWNIWQMDGLKGVIPESCTWVKEPEQVSMDELLGICAYNADIKRPLENHKKETACPGCKTKDMYRHIGIYCKIMDWEEGKELRFVDVPLSQKKDQ